MEDNKCFAFDFNIVKISVVYTKHVHFPLILKRYLFLGMDSLRLTMLVSESSFYHDALKRA